MLKPSDTPVPPAIPSASPATPPPPPIDWIRKASDRVPWVSICPSAVRLTWPPWPPLPPLPPMLTAPEYPPLLALIAIERPPEPPPPPTDWTRTALDWLPAVKMVDLIPGTVSELP